MNYPACCVREWLNQADIFLNTSNIDNTPVSVVEALACGLCVVSTNVGGIPFLVQNNCNALVVGPDDVRAMSDAVRRILEDTRTAEMLSVNGRATAGRYDWSCVLPKWTDGMRHASACQIRSAPRPDAQLSSSS